MRSCEDLHRLHLRVELDQEILAVIEEINELHERLEKLRSQRRNT